MRPSVRRWSSPSVRTLSVLFLSAFLLAVLSPGPAYAQSTARCDSPIIDMHLHAYTQGSYWGAIPHPATGTSAPPTAEEHRTETLAIMDRNGVVLGAISGDGLAAAEAWTDQALDSFLTGIEVHDPAADLEIETFVTWMSEGRLDVFAEIGAQYRGATPPPIRPSTPTGAWPRPTESLWESTRGEVSPAPLR